MISIYQSYLIEKFIKSKEDFIKNQKIIKHSIQNNLLISNGNEFATLINSYIMLMVWIMIMYLI